MAKFSRPLKVTIMCILWYALSSTNNVIGKKVLRSHPYPLTLSVFHMAANAFFMYPVLMLVGLQTRFHFSRHMLWRFIIPLGFGKLLGSVASHVSIWRVSVSYAHTIKGMLPIFTVTLSRIFYNERQSTIVYLSLVPIVVGVAIATMTELSFEFYGMLSAVLATCTFAVQNLYSKTALKEARLNPLQLLMKMSQVALFICVPLGILIDTTTMAHDPGLAEIDERFDLLFKLSLSGVINFVQNIVAFSVLHLLSPLSYSVANATKRILVITVSLITLKNPVTLVNFFGMMLAVAGVFLYNRAKIYQNSKHKILPTTNQDITEPHEEHHYVSSRYRMFSSKLNYFI